jgi:hypothetical protein
LDTAGNIYVLGDSTDNTPSLRKLKQGPTGASEEWVISSLPKDSYYAYNAGMAVDGAGNTYVETHFGYGPAYRFDISAYDATGSSVSITTVSVIRRGGYGNPRLRRMAYTDRAIVSRVLVTIRLSITSTRANLRLVRSRRSESPAGADTSETADPVAITGRGGTEPPYPRSPLFGASRIRKGFRS